MNKLPTIHIDEAGYTGYDLLNADQRFQGAAAVLIDDLSANQMIKEYFPSTQMTELKHRKLSRRKSNWKQLLEIQDHVLRNHLSVTYICDKRYLLTLMFLNSCLEPAFHDRGIDFYQDGHSYALASLLYRTAPTLWGPGNFDDLLALFQHAQRSKTDVGIQALVEKARSLRGRELHEYLLPLCAEWPSCLADVRNPKTNTDAALVVLLALISHIEKFVAEPYSIIHDTSENLRQYNQLLLQLVACDAEAIFYQTLITSIRFPLKLAAVSQIDSQRSAGVQLADLLIGGMTEYANTLVGKVEKNDYNQAIPPLYGESNIIFLWPTLDFEQNKQFRAGTNAQELIDFFASNFK